jgi:hypothetical protein
MTVELKADAKECAAGTGDLALYFSLGSASVSKNSDPHMPI